MAGGELHEVSVQIGKLLAHAEEQRTSTEALWREVKGVRDELAPLTGLVKRVETVEGKVETHSNSRYFALGAISVISATFGAIGAAIAAKLGLK